MVWFLFYSPPKLRDNNVTISNVGLLLWTLQPADTAILDVSKQVEERIALFEWSWAVGAKQSNHEVKIHVQNVTKIP